MNRPVHVWKSLRRQPSRWLLYLGLALFALAWESGGELLSLLPFPNSETAFVPSMVYQRFATLAYRKPRPHFVRLVVMSPTYDPIVFSNLCEKREYEAALIRKLKEVSPSVIVLDFSYASQACETGENAKKSMAFTAALSEVSQSVPIVVGLVTHTKHQFEHPPDPDLEKLVKAGFTRKDQVLDAHVIFGYKNISYGLVRINSDTRRVPIFWNVYASKDAVLSKLAPLRLPTLAFTAASLRDSSIPQVLAKINQADEHPFTSFITESAFQPVRAIDLLCNPQPGANQDWKTCAPPDLGADPRFSHLKGGQIILIGENSGDIHKSVIGEVPGYVLQANYIEALLDDRRFRPIYPLLEVFCTFMGVVVILLIFEIFANPAASDATKANPTTDPTKANPTADAAKVNPTTDATKANQKAKRILEFLKNLIVPLVISYGFVFLVAGVCNVLGIYLGRFIGFWIPLLSIPPVEAVFIWRLHSVPKTVNSPSKAEPAKAG